jgi:hypothetical protein
LNAAPVARFCIGNRISCAVGPRSQLLEQWAAFCAHLELQIRGTRHHRKHSYSPSIAASYRGAILRAAREQLLPVAQRRRSRCDIVDWAMRLSADRGPYVVRRTDGRTDGRSAFRYAFPGHRCPRNRINTAAQRRNGRGRPLTDTADVYAHARIRNFSFRTFSDPACGLIPPTTV